MMFFESSLSIPWKIAACHCQEVKATNVIRTAAQIKESNSSME